MKRLFLCAFLLLVAFSASLAQTDDDKAKAIAELRFKIHEIELYDMILPVVMTKDQIRAVLTVVEKCQDRARKLMLEQYKTMVGLEPTIDDAIKKAEKDQVASPDVVEKLLQANALNTTANEIVTEQNVEDIYEVVTKQLNAGQLKAMANSLNPKEFPDWLKNPDQVSQEDKEKLFIRAVFMDWDAYNILKKMSI